jgi:hypothetical protein
MEFKAAGILWNFLSLGSLLVSVYLLIKMMKDFSWRKFMFYVFVFTIPFFPVKFNLGMGQINLFLLFFSVLSIFLYRKNHKSLSAIVLAYAIGVKFAPIVFILYFAVKKDWIHVLRVVLYSVLFFLMPVLFVPINWQRIYYRDVFPMSWTLAAKDWYYNQSLEGFISRSFHNPTIILASTYIFTILIGLSTYIRGRSVSWQRAVGACACLYLLIHPIALQHYFGFSIIPLIFLVDDFRATTTGKGQWLFLILGYFLIAGNIKNFDSIPRNINFLLSHQFYGILILWILVLWKEKAPRIILTLTSAALICGYILFGLCKAKVCF